MSCELCGKQGTIKCPHCASFYCSMAHRDLDKSIHSSICSKLSVARETSTSPEIARQMKVEIIQIAREKAKEYLELRESELVIPSALQFLRFSSELDRDSLDCIEANLMLVEASLGLKRYGEVQEFLSRANWSILKAGESCPSSLRAQLHHHFGKLYASLGRIEDSTQNLALSVYFSSLEEGPASVGIGQSLFHMAEIFYSQNKVEHALAFFDKVVDIWYKFLNASKDGNEIKIPTKRELEDAKGMLMRILESRENFLGVTHLASAEVRQTLGLLNKLLKNNEEALEYLNSSLVIYKKEIGESAAVVSEVMATIEELSLRT